jgi:hypothetical protein
VSRSRVRHTHNELADTRRVITTAWRLATIDSG